MTTEDSNASGLSDTVGYILKLAFMNTLQLYIICDDNTNIIDHGILNWQSVFTDYCYYNYYNCACMTYFSRLANYIQSIGLCVKKH